MKGNHWFIAGIIVFLVLMFAIECRLPKKFVWNPTFSHYDKQPFGCAVFDSLLSSSLPKGYSLSRKTFYELEQEDTTLRRGILVVTDNLHLTDVDVEAMLKMAGRGDRIMLVGSSFSRILKDTLGFECSYSYFSPFESSIYLPLIIFLNSGTGKFRLITINERSSVNLCKESHSIRITRGVKTVNRTSPSSTTAAGLATASLPEL